MYNIAIMASHIPQYNRIGYSIIYGTRTAPYTFGIINGGYYLYVSRNSFVLSGWLNICRGIGAHAAISAVN